MKGSGYLKKVALIKNQFSTQPLLNEETEKFSEFIFGNSKISLEIVLRQYLMMYLCNRSINLNFLKYFGSSNRFSHPLPKEWLKIIVNQEIEVSFFYSKILLFITTLRFLLIGIYWILRDIALNLFYLSQNHKKNVRHAFFMDIELHCLPNESEENGYNLITWYLNWCGRVKFLSEIRHNVEKSKLSVDKVDVINADYIPKLKIWGLIKFMGWSLVAVILSVIYLILGKWHNVFLLKEAAISMKFQMIEKEFLAREYLFSISNHIYRPLWTYVAENRGSKVTMYNYAASFPMLTSFPELGLKTMTWPRILQWSKPYANYIRDKLIFKGIEVIDVPCIYYSDYNIKLPKLTKKTIAIFDVSPWRASFHVELLTEENYRQNSWRAFLEDIYDSVNCKNIDILWKKKRLSVKDHDKTYMKFADDFVKREGVIDINPLISAGRLIKKADIIISAPFTSTSLIGEINQKPSSYYDPSGTFHKRDIAAQNILVLSNKNELAQWIKSLT